MTAPAGGLQGTLGEGAAPATPLTRGGFPQPATIKIATVAVARRSLVVCGIIPNTLPGDVVLVRDEGFV
ncbi:MAG TPA: hypothetical protein VF887_00330 [Gemmatimonadaceae bacterium]